MNMSDEIAHVGVVDRGLGLGLPRLLGFGIAGEGPDEVDLRQVAKHRGVQVTQLAADHQMQQLVGLLSGGLGGVGHGRLACGQAS